MNVGIGIQTTDKITVRLISKMGGDSSVVAAAKVSTSGEEALKFANPESADANAGLINYLIAHRHGTPFEHSALTFFVHCPAFVWWEWVRHRIGHSFNLESSRYKKLEPVFWVPRQDRPFIKPDGFKASRPTGMVNANKDEYALCVDSMVESYESAYLKYSNLIDAGVVNEVARAILPFSVYFSGWVTVNPRSLMAFLSLRIHDSSATFVSYPQAEIQEAAEAAEAIFRDGWPLTHAAFVKNGRVGP